MGRFISISFGLLVVFLSLSGIGAGLCCPLGWSSFDQHCYKVFEPLKNWTDAEECKWEWSDDSRFDYKAWNRRPYCTVMVLKPDKIFWFTRGCEKSVSFVCKFLTDPAV